ncbi:MAG: hypothetical protein A2868_03865 [Candidatus Levybacteria bacterium RIFCSPHIGHO2_01_FULL_40_15b]|nr:MAG: hypothetical protein A2868_03865 [Candidatus Levybacteria bacterium RIFCSPHIGHO2_01_FULL_40_15b]
MLEISPAQLRFFSAVCANMVVVWIAAIPGTRDSLILTLDIVLAIVFWRLGVATEEILDRL